MEQNAKVTWLPPYSPDFSPIELMCSKVKAYLKKAKARTQKELEKAIALAVKIKIWAVRQWPKNSELSDNCFLFFIAFGSQLMAAKAKHGTLLSNLLSFIAEFVYLTLTAISDTRFWKLKSWFLQVKIDLKLLRIF